MEKQEETIEKIKEYLQKDNTVVLFFDPCHLQHNVINAKMWQPRGREGTIRIKTNPGRKKINILGALDIKNFSVITTLTEDKCNKERVVEFLAKIRTKYLDKHIVIILNNAMYNHANYTKAFVEWYDIELFFLPTYSPNLNLIERLWKFTKQKLVHNNYYEKFIVFTKEVEKYFENLSDYKLELEKILTRKFQIIDNV